MRRTADFYCPIRFLLLQPTAASAGYSLGLKQTKIPAVSQLFEQTFLYFIRVSFLLLPHQPSAGSFHLFCRCWSCYGGDLCILLLPVLYTPHSFETSAEFAFCKYFLHPSFQAFQTRLSSYCQPGIIEHSAKYRSRILPVFLQYSGNVFFSVFAGIWSSDRYALPCILFPSAITNAVSSMLLPTVAEIQEMKREAQTSGYHFKNRLFLHISWMFLLYFPANIREMVGIFLFKMSACG